MCNRARWNVNDFFVTPVDVEARFGDNLTENREFDFPLIDNRLELLAISLWHNRHHALLRLAHQNFFWSERLVTLQNFLQLHAHSCIAI
jgi:hypothetical protein